MRWKYDFLGNISRFQNKFLLSKIGCIAKWIANRITSLVWFFRFFRLFWQFFNPIKFRQIVVDLNDNSASDSVIDLQKIFSLTTRFSLHVLNLHVLVYRRKGKQFNHERFMSTFKFLSIWLSVDLFSN